MLLFLNDEPECDQGLQKLHLANNKIVPMTRHYISSVYEDATGSRVSHNQSQFSQYE